MLRYISMICFNVTLLCYVYYVTSCYFYYVISCHVMLFCYVIFYVSVCFVMLDSSTNLCWFILS